MMTAIGAVGLRREGLWVKESGTTRGNARELVGIMQKRDTNILCVQETRWRGNNPHGREEDINGII